MAWQARRGVVVREPCIPFVSGTESILLAAKTHRDWYRAEKGVTEPEIVACVSAHAAIDKACNLMGIRLIKVLGRQQHEGRIGLLPGGGPAWLTCLCVDGRSR